MKNILLVGANSGIGLELGKLLLGNGVEVHQWSRTQGELSELGANWSELNLQGTLPQAPESLDGVVYLPGTIRLKPFHRIKEEEFIEDFEINALGAAKVLQQAQASLKKGSAPSVVLFSSVAVGTGLAFHASISMAKAAVEGLTKALAAEWAPLIRVNAIAPSLTHTPLAGNLLSSDAKVEASSNRHPLKKVGCPQQMAKLAQFLLSEDASFVTGQIVSADGGLGSLRL